MVWDDGGFNVFVLNSICECNIKIKTEFSYRN